MDSTWQKCKCVPGKSKEGVKNAPPHVFNVAGVKVRGGEVKGAALEGVKGQTLLNPLVHPIEWGVSYAVCTARGWRRRAQLQALASGHLR